MTILKRISRSAAAHRIVCRIIALYIRFVHATSSWTVTGTEDRDRLFAAGQPYIIALWHNRIFMMPYAFFEKADQLCILASGHRDGRLVLDTMGRFGFEGIPVNSRDAAKATRAAVKRLKAGGHVGITPDGPRGPALIVKDGVIAIAALARVPIIPVSYAMKRRRILSTWDRFHLPMPFTRGICKWGEVIQLPEKTDAETREECRKRLELALQDLTESCEREVAGHR